MDIKPIETAYKGYRFRSRTEARWAVFLDHLGIAWEYEKEGFELPSGRRYLPDFYLTKSQQWLEIKPNTEAGWQGERVYLAGPIPEAREGNWRRGVRFRTVTGPDTRKGHGPNIHGMTDEDDCGAAPDPDEILDRCLRQIEQCDTLMAWIPDRERYGTIAEIGYARGLGKRIVVAIGKNAVVSHPSALFVGEAKLEHGAFQGHELWFVERMADEVFFDVSEVQMQQKFSYKLTKDEEACSELSRGTHRTVLLARGSPGERENPITPFLGGSPQWNGWPNTFGSMDQIGRAVTAARSARFEHGESGAPL